MRNHGRKPIGIRLGNAGQTAYARPQGAGPALRMAGFKAAKMASARSGGLRSVLMRRLESVAFGLFALFMGAAGSARADDLLGQPTPGAMDLQPGASALKHQAIFFH